MNKKKSFILWFDELGIEDVPLVGGKNASLGEMYRNLTGKGVRIPNGFAVTAYAYNYLLEKAKIKDEIKQILRGLNTSNMKNLSDRGRKVRETILKAEFPKELREEIINSYVKLCRRYGQNTDVAVRSSATAEDLPDASFAGQQETYLNIRGGHELIEACKKCFASLFTNRAISYRVDKHFDHFKVALSIGVQKMVRSDKACSGVMFSIDTETGFKDAVLINGAYGLGENVVLGFFVFEPVPDICAGDGFDAPYPLGDGAFRRNFKLADLAGVLKVRSAAKFFGIPVDGHNADRLSIFFGKKGQGAAFFGFFEGHNVFFNSVVGLNIIINQRLNFV